MIADCPEKQAANVIANVTTAKTAGKTFLGVMTDDSAKERRPRPATRTIGSAMRIKDQRAAGRNPYSALSEDVPILCMTVEIEEEKEKEVDLCRPCEHQAQQWSLGGCPPPTDETGAVETPEADPPPGNVGMFIDCATKGVEYL